MTSFRAQPDAAAVGTAIYAALPDMTPRERHLVEHLMRILGDRDRAFEDFIASGGFGGSGGVSFTYPGPLPQTDESPPWYPPVDTTFTTARLSLLANATVSTSVDIKQNGVVISTITLGIGAKTVTQAFVFSILHTDYLTTVLTAAGDANLSLELS